MTPVKNKRTVKGTKDAEIEIAARKYSRLVEAFFKNYRAGDKWRMQLSIAEIDMREAKKELDRLHKTGLVLNKKRKDYEEELKRRGIWPQVMKRSVKSGKVKRQ